MKRIAFITGGTRGIGFGIATQLAVAGFDIAINGVRPETDAAEAINTLKDFGNDVIYCRGDIATSADRQQMLQQVKAHYRKLHVLVNNAGIAPRVRNDI